MKNVPIFALEGAAFAGKTTLLQFLKRNYSNEIITIAEASEYVGGDHNFPDVPFKTYDDARASTYYFIELEKQRCLDAQEAYAKNGKPIIFDRTTPISSSIFYSLLAHTDTDHREFIDAFYQHALEAFQFQIDKGNIFIPGGIIYLRPDSRETFESRLKRGTKNSVFSNWESYRFLDDKYQNLIKQHYHPENVLILDSQNTQENLEENAGKVIKFIGSTNPPLNKNIFDNFLNEGRKFSLNIADSEEEEFKVIREHVKMLINKTKRETLYL